MAYVGVATGGGDAGTAAVGSVVLTLPGTAAVGDTVIVPCAENLATITVNTPAGYGVASGPNDQSTNMRAYVFAKSKVDAADISSGTITVALASGTRPLIAAGLVMRGENPAAAILAISAPTTGGAGLSFTLPTAATGQAGADVIAIVTARRASNPVGVITLPAGYTQRDQNTTNIVGANVDVAVGTLDTVGAPGSYGGGTVNLSQSSVWVAYVVAMDTLTAVTPKTIATSWNVRSSVTPKTVATSWNVRSIVAAKTIATTWAVRAAVAAKTVATSWNVRAAVMKTIATSWNVRAAISRAVATTWNVRSRIAAKTVATTWRVRQPVTRTVSTTWNVRAGVTPKTITTSWNVRHVITPKTIATTWNVESSLIKVDIAALVASVRLRPFANVEPVRANHAEQMRLGSVIEPVRVEPFSTDPVRLVSHATVQPVRTGTQTELVRTDTHPDPVRTQRG